MFSVSVIIPTFNRRETLSRALASVIAQSRPPEEILVVDDGSTDGTAELVTNRAETCGLLRLLVLPENRGVSHARNQGIQATRGEWIAFLDSDDEWLPNKLQKQIELLTGHPRFKVVHGEEIWIRNGVRVNAAKKHAKSGGRIYEKSLPLCVMSPSTIMIHRSVFEEVGVFDPAFTVCEDYELWLRITARYEIGFVTEPIIRKYGGHADQLSSKYKAMDYWRVKALARMLNDPFLSESEKARTREVLMEKAGILMNGYCKHGNMTNFAEVERWFTTASQATLSTDGTHTPPPRPNRIS